MIKIIVTYSILAFSISIFFFSFDKELFYYGKSIFKYYKPLPLGIKAVNDNDFMGFYLDDGYGFSLISKGECDYVDSETKFYLNRIIKYGYNNETLIALVEDSHLKKYYIECTKNDPVKSKRDISINIIDGSDPIRTNLFTWVVIDEQNFNRIQSIRNLLLLSFMLLSLGFVLIVRLLNRKK